MEDQVLEILAAIEAPVLSITALPLPRWVDPETATERLQVIRNCRSHSLPGHHHFHMDVPGEIAPVILEFINSTEITDVPSQI
jgi:pimeloyl-ACP methyl ester carboxylesterase